MSSISIFSLKRWGMLLVLFLVASLFVEAQDIKVIVKAPQSVLVGQEFKVTYTVENAGGKAKDPIIFKNMADLEVIYGPSFSTSSSTTFDKGKRVENNSATTTYVVKASQKGKITLPQGQVVIDGKRYRSQSLKIEAKDAVSMAKDVNAFIKVLPSRTKVGESDTLTVTYKLYTTHDITQVIDSDFPPLRDFFVSSRLDSRQFFTEETIDGTLYKVVEIRKLLLQPKKEGVLTIPEGSVTLLYSFPTGKRVNDIWGDTYQEQESIEKEVKAEAVIIRVQNLIAI